MLPTWNWNAPPSTEMRNESSPSSSSSALSSLPQPASGALADSHVTDSTVQDRPKRQSGKSRWRARKRARRDSSSLTSQSSNLQLSPSSTTSDTVVSLVQNFPSSNKKRQRKWRERTRARFARLPLSFPSSLLLPQPPSVSPVPLSPPLSSSSSARESLQSTGGSRTLHAVNEQRSAADAGTAFAFTPAAVTATDTPANAVKAVGVCDVVAMANAAVEVIHRSLATSVVLSAASYTGVRLEDWEQHRFSMLHKQQSSLPSAGYGVFATAAVSAKQMLLKYHGTEMDYAAATEKFNIDAKGAPTTNLDAWRYVLRLNSNRYIDASMPEQFGLAHFINHNHRTLCNCKFNANGVVMSTKKIHPGDELFLDYGEDFTAFLEIKEITMPTVAQYEVIRDKRRVEAAKPRRLFGGETHSSSALSFSSSAAGSFRPHRTESK